MAKPDHGWLAAKEIGDFLGRTGVLEEVALNRGASGDLDLADEVHRHNVALVDDRHRNHTGLDRLAGGDVLHRHLDGASFEGSRGLHVGVDDLLLVSFENVREWSIDFLPGADRLVAEHGCKVLVAYLVVIVHVEVNRLGRLVQDLLELLCYALYQFFVVFFCPNSHAVPPVVSGCDP